MPNVEALKETLAHIEANPEAWHQGAFRCGTGMCFAGWRAELSGGQWAFDVKNFYSHALLAEPADLHTFRYHGKKLVGAFDRAPRLLGLTSSQAERLFDAENTLDDLRRIVAELCEEADDADR